MKLRLLLLPLLLVFMACQQHITPSDVPAINGYWEIEKVVFPEGDDKDYKINETFDYFQVDKNNKGFRKKVMPQLNGTFLANNDFETIKIIFENDKAFIQYSTPYAKWKEELRGISEDEMVLVNPQGIAYHYKKTAPINLLEDGEKNK
ncbi:MAG TPA: hypothetical protein VF677_06670 [Flavobacterium sp.]